MVSSPTGEHFYFAILGIIPPPVTVIELRPLVPGRINDACAVSVVIPQELGGERLQIQRPALADPLLFVVVGILNLQPIRVRHVELSRGAQN
jgi:hypothetical protein